MIARRRLLAALPALALPASAAGADDATPLRFTELYTGATYQEGIGATPALRISARVQALTGQRVQVLGFMDGLLPRDGMHFMLLREPSFLCPFHTTSFDWAGFLPVFAARPVEYVDGPVRVTGRLDSGRKTDEMGLISHVRLYDARLERWR